MFRSGFAWGGREGPSAEEMATPEPHCCPILFAGHFAMSSLAQQTFCFLFLFFFCSLEDLCIHKNSLRLSFMDNNAAGSGHGRPSFTFLCGHNTDSSSPTESTQVTHATLSANCMVLQKTISLGHVVVTIFFNDSCFWVCHRWCICSNHSSVRKLL